MDNSVTVIIPTSPRPTHPDPTILDSTVASVRAALPDAPIIITCDGIPDPDYSRQLASAYSGFKTCIHGRYDNATVLEFDQHSQQSGMLGRALELVQTRLILYCEDDWLIFQGIEWDELGTIITSGYANYIRLYANCRIHPMHEGMMLERVIWQEKIPLVKTLQFSANPHLASTEWYRTAILPRCVGKIEAIENIMHSPCACGPDWGRWKLCIYNPMNMGSMQCVRHLDGRRLSL